MVNKVLTAIVVTAALALLLAGMAAQQLEHKRVAKYCRGLNAAGRTVLPGDALQCARVGVKIMRVYEYEN